MGSYKFKYGNSELESYIDDNRIINILVPSKTTPLDDLRGEVHKVLDVPTGALPLKDIIKPEEKVVIIVSDITRLWIKTDLYLKYIIEYINNIGVADNQITIIIALGSHRPSTEAEKESIVGDEVYKRIEVVDHDCFNQEENGFVGHSAVGTPIYINKRVLEADRVILTGGIVFHLFAGFGGGAKSIVPGVAGIETIQHNHRLTFNKGEGTGLNPMASSNVIKGNPMREDITDICRKIKPDFLVNAILDTEGNFLKLVAGDFEEAWLEGCEFIRSCYGVGIEEKADIIVASAGGYPKDINLYQTVKTMDNCLYGGKVNSIIVLMSECRDGLGAAEFMDWFQYKTIEAMEMALKRNFTVPGYAAYKTAYTGVNRRVVLVSSLPEEQVKELGFLPAKSLNEAMEVAYKLSPPNPKITLMPYGGTVLSFQS